MKIIRLLIHFSLLAFLWATTVCAEPLISHSLMIVDAGSNASRVHLYDIAYENEQDATIKQVAYHSITPSLSSDEFATMTPEQQQAYFEQLLAGIQPKPSADSLPSTGAFLFATGGVRQLNASVQHQRMEQARAAFNQALLAKGFPALKSPDDQVRVLTGGEEAAFSWLAVNVHFQTLGSETTYANLEMGGASHEVAFSSPVLDPYTISLHNTHHKIYARAYDGYGIKAALQKAAKKNQQRPGLEACFLRGSTYPLDSPTEDAILGDGDFDRCVAWIKNNLTEPTSLCESHIYPCNGFGISQPTFPPGRVILTSGYFYTLRHLGISNAWIKPALLPTTARHYCARPWQNVLHDPALGHEKNEYLAKVCFEAAYYQATFDSLGINDQHELMSVRIHAGSTVSWPLGAAYYLSKQAASYRDIF